MGADIQQAYAQFALVGRKRASAAAIDSSTALRPQALPVGAGHCALQRAAGTGGDVQITSRRDPTMPTGSKMPGCPSRINWRAADAGSRDPEAVQARAGQPPCARRRW